MRSLYIRIMYCIIYKCTRFIIIIRPDTSPEFDRARIIFIIILYTMVKEVKNRSKAMIVVDPSSSSSRVTDTPCLCCRLTVGAPYKPF